MPDGERSAPEDRAGTGPFAWVLAFAVHVFTAAGAALGLLALIAAVAHDWPLMFTWLGVALLVDGIDGTFARALHVAERLPRWSGDTLDFVVDFATYVFVPAYAIVAGGLLPAPLAIPAGVVIVVTSAIYFADGDMKMTDNCFRGFPALWNVAAFYLFLVRPDPWLCVAAIVVLAVLTFVSLPFVHPLRVRRFRAVSIALLVAWIALGAFAIARDLAPGPWVTAALCAIALYFCAIGALRRTA
jgi:phosphatidylcholine synthase